MSNIPNIIQRNGWASLTPTFRRPEYIVLHYTAGINSAQGCAISVADYFARGVVEASADFICDDVQIVQYNPNLERYYTWAVGGSRYNYGRTSQSGNFYGACGNWNSVSIEMCSRKINTTSLAAEDADWYLTDATIENAVKLTKYLMALYNIDINHVIMHHQVTGKLCPQPWCLNEDRLAGWDDFCNRVMGNSSATSAKAESDKNTKFPKVPFEIKVIDKTLKIREKPDSKAKVIKQAGVTKRTVVKLVNEHWGRLKAKQEGKTGYINLINKKRVTIGKHIKTEEEKNSYKVKITASVLNVRSGAGTSHKIVGTVKKGEVYTIVETKNVWGKLKSGKGWICLDYCRKI